MHPMNTSQTRFSLIKDLLISANHIIHFTKQFYLSLLLTVNEIRDRECYSRE